jgi:hypothetical protein
MSKPGTLRTAGPTSQPTPCASCRKRDAQVRGWCRPCYGTWYKAGQKSPGPPLPARRGARHGTTAGYAKHLRFGTEPCVKCRQAVAKSSRKYHEANKKKTAAIAIAKARNAEIERLALEELARRHPAEISQIRRSLHASKVAA